LNGKKVLDFIELEEMKNKEKDLDNAILEMELLKLDFGVGEVNNKKLENIKLQ
jgi:hypothetical protein